MRRCWCGSCSRRLQIQPSRSSAGDHHKRSVLPPQELPRDRALRSRVRRWLRGWMPVQPKQVLPQPEWQRLQRAPASREGRPLPRERQTPSATNSSTPPTHRSPASPLLPRKTSPLGRFFFCPSSSLSLLLLVSQPLSFLISK